MQLRIAVDHSNWGSHGFQCRVCFTLSLLILAVSLLFYAHDVLKAVFILAILQYVRALGKHNIYFNLTILQSLQSNSVAGLYCCMADAACMVVVKLMRRSLVAESAWQQCTSCLCLRNEQHSVSLYFYKCILFPLPPPPPPFLLAHTHVGWYLCVKKCAIWKKEHLDAMSSSFFQQGVKSYSASVKFRAVSACCRRSCLCFNDCTWNKRV